MKLTIRVMLVCAALGGCASSGSLSSLSSVGGPGQPETPKATAASQTAPEQGGSSSGLGGIWKNFSSTFSSGTQPVSQKLPEKPDSGLDTNEALRLINDYRATKHLAPLSLDPSATAAAEAIAKDMAAHDRKSASTLDLGKRLLAAGYSYRLAAENASVGQASVDAAIEGWKKSAEASRNMLLANAKHIGIAYEFKADTAHKTFWTLIVAAP